VVRSCGPCFVSLEFQAFLIPLSGFRSIGGFEPPESGATTAESATSREKETRFFTATVFPLAVTLAMESLPLAGIWVLQRHYPPCIRTDSQIIIVDNRDRVSPVNSHI
jgi:hypothetical protein